MPRKQDQIDLSGLYPELGPEELEHAYERLRRYIAVICSIAEREEREGKRAE